MSNLLGYSSLVSLRAGNFPESIARATATLNLHRETDSQLLTVDDFSILAVTYLEMGDISSALDYVGQALSILDECEGAGPEFPHRDYFIGYQVLSSVGQTEAAQAALQSAYNLVMERANKIIDPTLRQSFLENVKINQEILTAHKK